MSKRQSSLLTFFGKRPSQSESPKVPSSAANRKLSSSDAVGLKSSCSKENSKRTASAAATTRSPTKKRRRVVLDDDDDERDVAETPPPDDHVVDLLCADDSAAAAALDSSSLNISISDLSKSFLSAFRSTEDSADVTGQPDDTAVTASPPTTLATPRFKHLNLDFLAVENIRDGNKRRPCDDAYDARTLHVPDAFLKKETPGLRQWWQIKSQYFDAVIFFKVGKFYEMYHMDAVVCVQELNLTFMKGDYAHCGFPEMAYERFAEQLVARGYRVARVEQTETPTQLEQRNRRSTGGGAAVSKVVRRELCRLTTPATRSLDGGALSSTARPVYLLAVCERPSDADAVAYGVCVANTAIGKFEFGQFVDDFRGSRIRTLLATHPPAEVLLERGRNSSALSDLIKAFLPPFVGREVLPPVAECWSASEALRSLQREEYLGKPGTAPWPAALVAAIDANDPLASKPARGYDLALAAVGAVVWYLRRCLIDSDLISMRNFIDYKPQIVSGDDVGAKGRWFESRRMVLDGITIRNLNILPDAESDATSHTSLLNTIDRCYTQFGRRLLCHWVCSPLCDPVDIRLRQSAVAALRNESREVKDEAASLLRSMPDLEKLLRRIHELGSSHRAANHPDSRAVMFDSDKRNRHKIAQLISAIAGFRAVAKLFHLYSRSQASSPLLDRLFGSDQMAQISAQVEPFETMFDHEKAKSEGVILPKAGVDELFDAVCEKLDTARRSLDNYLGAQRRKLNCRSISYFGAGRKRYQLEIPDSIAKDLPADYAFQSQRKGFKRFYTAEIENCFAALQETESEKAAVVQDNTRRVFEKFDERAVDGLCFGYGVWLSATEAVAEYDALLSMAQYADSLERDVCLPELIEPDGDRSDVRVVDGVHPCLANGNMRADYIPNDLAVGSLLDRHGANVLLITGPNMGGKSTLMRQTALLVVLAQMGSFVPAKEMRLSPVDRVFTRLGASDRLSAGQSTFFVELAETNVVVRAASAHSLVLLDELGRGTATHDGSAIAAAVLSHLLERVRCRTLFSTHYHGLVARFGHSPAVSLVHMACVAESDGDDADPTDETVTFLYKLAAGACPKSYGFAAAKLAGIPLEVPFGRVVRAQPRHFR